MAVIRLTGFGLASFALSWIGHAHARHGSIAIPWRGVSAIARTADRFQPHLVMRAEAAPAVFLDRLRPDARIYWLAQWARRDLDCLDKVITALVHPGDTVVDVGSCYGWYAYLMALQVGPAGAVHAVEPHPELKSGLEAALGGFQQITRHDVGAGAIDGDAVFTIADRPAVSSFALYGNRAVRTVSVLMRRLDGLLRGVPSFVKIDVEGLEPEVIEGMDGFSAPRPFLFVEKPVDETRALRLWRLLEAASYLIYAVAEWTWRREIPLRHLTPAALPARWPDGWLNALAVPVERSDRFFALVASRALVLTGEW